VLADIELAQQLKEESNKGRSSTKGLVRPRAETAQMAGRRMAGRRMRAEGWWAEGWRPGHAAPTCAARGPHLGGAPGRPALQQPLVRFGSPRHGLQGARRHYKVPERHPRPLPHFEAPAYALRAPAPGIPAALMVGCGGQFGQRCSRPIATVKRSASRRTTILTTAACCGTAPTWPWLPPFSSPVRVAPPLASLPHGGCLLSSYPPPRP
jgi:hypothetical protein